MRIIKLILIIILIPVGLFMLFLIHSTMDDYQPKEVLEFGHPKVWDTLETDENYTLMSWNIGYAGLDAGMDFFYDGGKRVRPSVNQVYENFSNIREFVEDNDSLNFILLQEVDRSSKRSYHLNEVMELRESLGSFEHYFGKNYDVAFVPVPVTKPMGRVLSGIVSFTKNKPYESFRYSFPGNYSWPTKLFMLDRCFLVSRFKTISGKDFILINTHNSAYDDGSLRKQQMEYLKNFIENEYNAGNYVLVGGDWNQSPPHMMPEQLDQPFDTLNMSFVPDNYLPDTWTWAFDPGKPTNRRVTEKYERGKTLTTIIDFLLVSPNIKIINIKTIDLGFKISDHQPVIATFKFRE